MKKLYGIAGKYILFLLGGGSLVAVIVTPWLVSLYVGDESQVFALAVSAIRWFILSLPFRAINDSYINLIQITHKMEKVHIWNLYQNLIFPVVLAVVLGKTRGIQGVFVSAALAEILLTVSIVLYTWIKERKVAFGIESIMNLPKCFGVEPENKLEKSIQTMDQVILLTEHVGKFCKKYGVDRQKTYDLTVCIQEIVESVIKHGIKSKKCHTVDIQLMYEKKEIILCIRHDCRMFDIQTHMEKLDDINSTSSSNIKNLLKMAKNITYTDILKINSLTLRV